MVDPSADPTILIPSSGLSIPQSAFGLYRVPASEEGESIILDAVKVREREQLSYWYHYYSFPFLCSNISSTIRSVVSIKQCI